jgi:hypothetical protein
MSPIDHLDLVLTSLRRRLVARGEPLERERC